MRRLVVALAVLGTGLAAAQSLVSFQAEDEGAAPYVAASVRLDDDRLATIAVVGAELQGVKAVGNGSEGGETEFETIGHDPVTRLTILRAPRGPDEAVAPRGSSLALEPGDALYLDQAATSAASRAVKWENSYEGKVLPVSLIRVHHAGEEPPKPGAPLFNAEGELVAICHQAAPQFGNGTFALPVEVIGRVEADLETRGRVAACWIGITVDASDPVLAIQMVRPGSPGAEAGLRKGDILLTVGPRRVRSYADARNAFYYLVSGETTPLEVLRGTQKLSLKVVPTVHPTLNLPEESGD